MFCKSKLEFNDIISNSFLLHAWSIYGLTAYVYKLHQCCNAIHCKNTLHNEGENFSL